jgi:hypothetical protein
MKIPVQLHVLAARLFAPAGCAALAALALRGGFSNTHVFYLRDLSFAFWPAHVWLRDTILAGRSPFWDPYVAFGQSAVADPVRQILFPPTLLLRSLLPAVAGFNAAVLLAFPVAAVGMFLFLRRRGSRAAAALGASLFALSGPVLSTGNMLNLSWSVALAPWMLWSADSPTDPNPARRVAALALATALQFLAGEPVTFALTAFVVLAYAAVAPDEGGRRRLRAAAQAAAGLSLGVLLAAIQLFPLADAAARSVRAAGFDSSVARVGEVHPLSLVESLMPGLYGDPWDWATVSHLWLSAFNGGREPFLYSIYVGVAGAMLALYGALVSPRRRHALFWSSVFVGGLVCALGDFTPVLPALREILPPARSFRIPAKYLVLAALALATLAALGWEALAAAQTARAQGRRVVVAAAGLVSLLGCALLACALLVPGPTEAAVLGLARAAGVEPADAGARYLLSLLPASGLRLAVLAAATAAALWLSATHRREARLACAILFGMAIVDPLVVNSGVNPVTDVNRLGRPAWLSLVPDPNERIYVGGRLPWAVYGEPEDIDNPPPRASLEVRPYTLQEQIAIDSVDLMTFPSAWRVRDTVSIDNNALWPREYTAALKRLRQSDRATRTRFLARASARYFAAPEPPSPTALLLGRAGAEQGLGLYEEPGAAPRAEVVPDAEVEADSERALDRLFAPDFDPGSLVVDAVSPAAGDQGLPGDPRAAILDDPGTAVLLRAHAPDGGGYLVLRDSYSPHWRAEVDGREAPLLRAFGLFRAVRLAPGPHVVRLVFSPTPVYAGATVSILTALILLCLALRSHVARVATLWKRKQIPSARRRRSIA